MSSRQTLRALRIEEDEWPGPLNGDKFGGYPAWEQAPEYPAWPDCTGPMAELVAQLESNGIAGVQCGDLGTAYVLRCPNHSECVDVIWQCG